jgi:hypothetical protein
MKFLYDDQRTREETSLYTSALANQWNIHEVFKPSHTPLTCEFKTETERLKWAPVLVSLAFGEGTAFYGFGDRIKQADDLSTRSWLSIHLLDEARHTEGFSRFLDYFYPSFRGQQHTLLDSRDVTVFYGRTERCESILEWLICTQIAEIFGRHCYKAVHQVLAPDPTASLFFAKILGDENRHIAYIGSLIRKRYAELSARDFAHTQDFLHRMMQYGRNMFESRKKGANFHAFTQMGIDVSAFCDRAEEEILKKIAMEEVLS